jgi:tRNA uridine 5-carboxymethylaminomethyl modification enzyme
MFHVEHCICIVPLGTDSLQPGAAGPIPSHGRRATRMLDSDSRPIPARFSFSGIPGLSREMQEKLERVRPETPGQAGRIPGMTPAAIAVHNVYLNIFPPCRLIAAASVFRGASDQI